MDLELAAPSQLDALTPLFERNGTLCLGHRRLLWKAIVPQPASYGRVGAVRPRPEREI